MAPFDLGKQTRSHVAQSLFWLDGNPYSLKDYPFMPAIFDTGAVEVLMKTSRQISKTVDENTAILLSDGTTRRIADIKVGDQVVTLAEDVVHLTVGTVTWKSKRYHKTCRRIKTRLGHETVVVYTHPIRCWDSWVPAAKLHADDRIAVIRHGGVFTATKKIDADLLEFLALMLGDGSCACTPGQLSFSKNEESVLYPRFIALINRRKWAYKEYPRTHKTTGRVNVSIRLSTSPHQEPRKFLASLGLYGCRSAGKFIPEAVFSLDRAQTSFFLNRLWSTDGWVTKPKNSLYSIGYSTTSPRLAKDVQHLLWKFGIPASVHRSKPKYYRNTRKFSYVVRIETQTGIERFLDEIGAIGKSERIAHPTTEERNNRDTYPIEIGQLIHEINASAGRTGRRGCKATGTLYSDGIHVGLSWPPTKTRVRGLVQHFRKSTKYDQKLVDKLESHLTTDLYWDKIVSIRTIGVRPCYDISVSGGESFVGDGIVSHNSTTCACMMLANSVIRDHFRTLYVSPLREQTSRFSNTRLSKIIHYSPLVRKNYVDPTMPNNVLLQILKNGSEMALSYAWDDPDRVRGITADHEFVDEVQDMLYESVIPVIKECMANSDYGFTTYCGTPKTLENTIEYIWQQSTKSEWIMLCEGCNHWQYIDSVKSIGKHGVICVHCGKSLNPRSGKWYDFTPTSKIRGYHISQPMLPRNNEMHTRWERILAKLETYSESKFKNEVLGLSDAVGTRFITQEELVALCGDYFVDIPIQAKTAQDVRAIAAGVDWAGNGEGYNFRTVVWVFGLLPDFRMKTLYYKIFPNANAIGDVNEVAEILEKCGVRYVVGDAGEGAVANSVLRDKLGAHRVGQAQYGGGAGFTKLIGWNKQGNKYLINRTAAIDSYMLQLKKQGIVFPNPRQMATPIQDILNEYESSITASSGGVSKKAWLHAPNAPDDCLHAQIFGWFAMKILQGDIEMYDREIEENP